jgi:gamma-glutamyltranspeptidase / glutathione hydrolase
MNLSTRGSAMGGKLAMRPTAMGRQGAVTSGHPLSTLVGLTVLMQGGNAVDAGVAAALAGCVVQSDIVSFAGIACIQIHSPWSGETVSIAGVGHWPELASLEDLRNHCGRIPADVRNAVVPGAPDAYFTALERFGTWTFGRVAAHAIGLAKDGFAMFPFRYVHQLEYAEIIRRTPSTREVFWPEGRQPEVGELFRQPDLARSLESIVDAESSASSHSRNVGLRAARDAFYTGDIAQRIDRFYRESGGYLRMRDLDGFRAEVTTSILGGFRGVNVAVCPFWSKGPMLLQILNTLAQDSVAELGHNSTAYIHLLTEAMKLAFADRHAYYGDPRFIDVPVDGLLSSQYGLARRALIRADQAWAEMPPAGDPFNGGARRQTTINPLVRPQAAGLPSDTSHLSVIDRDGLVFSVTFSDPFNYAPITPGTGLLVSDRGIQAWADPDHPNRVRPGQRPLVTGNPVLVFRDNRLLMALGSPGADVQVQAILQVLLNIVLFNMDCQQAVEAPRFATYSHPNSFEPHVYEPGVLRVESTIPPDTLQQLEELGHKVIVWPPYAWQAGGIGVIVVDEQGMIYAGADPRRENYSLAW